MKVNGNYSDLWKAVIRPFRHQYEDLGMEILFLSFVRKQRVHFGGKTVQAN